MFTQNASKMRHLIMLKKITKVPDQRYATRQYTTVKT